MVPARGIATAIPAAAATVEVAAQARSPDSPQSFENDFSPTDVRLATIRPRINPPQPNGQHAPQPASSSGSGFAAGAPFAATAANEAVAADTSAADGPSPSGATPQAEGGETSQTAIPDSGVAPVAHPAELSSADAGNRAESPMQAGAGGEAGVEEAPASIWQPRRRPGRRSRTSQRSHAAASSSARPGGFSEDATAVQAHPRSSTEESTASTPEAEQVSSPAAASATASSSPASEAALRETAEPAGPPGSSADTEGRAGSQARVVMAPILIRVPALLFLPALGAASAQSVVVSARLKAYEL